MSTSSALRPSSPQPSHDRPGDGVTQTPETRYARAADGIHVGYQVVGSGPVDIVFVPYDYSNIGRDLLTVIIG
jgi:hypothetical protein